MAASYQEYLASQVLNEGSIVSYRLLGRALGVHNNAAKQMLFEFHRKQNQKKPGSVHATFLLSGTRRAEPPDINGINGHDGGDVPMSDSPFPSSAVPAPEAQEDRIPTTSVMLVQEGDLEDARARFETLASIHVHSLAATEPKDIHLLSTCNRNVLSQYSKDDPLQTWSQYGTIQNPNVKRRSLKRGPPKSAASKQTESKPTAQPQKPLEKAPPKSATSQSNTPAASTPDSSSKGASKPRGKADIFAAFSKGKQKPKAAPEPKDEPMKDASEDEQEEDLKFENKGDAEEHRRKKAAREEALRNMMDEDDEPMADAPEEDEAEEEEAEPAHQEEPDESAADAPIDKPVQPAVEQKQETVTVEGGRRRGRRRVMKKKTVKDEEGYLVTKEEPEWESFSEEEPEPKKPKTLPSSGSTKAPKGSQKKGQGNIMSFFKKT